jgi:hypothetical protein
MAERVSEADEENSGSQDYQQKGVHLSTSLGKEKPRLGNAPNWGSLDRNMPEK